MEELDNTMIGRGRDAIDMIIDKDSFQENIIDGYSFDPDYGPGSVVGTAKLNGKPTTIIANDAMAFNDRFPVVFGGVIGLEEGYKMATAVYRTMEADKDKPLPEKRAIVLIVDTPGNGPGKMEEIAGMNKSTGGYQLALAEARKAGHPIVAMVIGRAISGAFLRFRHHDPCYAADLHCQDYENGYRTVGRAFYQQSCFCSRCRFLLQTGRRTGNCQSGRRYAGSNYPAYR